jgi:ectoine hydroxylase-related dioxygenase (phytanoyl-CoA dioxygenase family)
MTMTKDGLDLLEGNLADRVRALGLERHVAELHTQGYTIVESAVSDEFIDEVRGQIVALVESQNAAGTTTNIGDAFGESAWKLLARGRIFEEAVCHPYFVTLNDVMLGKGWRVAVVGGTVKKGGAGPMRLHTDYDAGLLIREPYPIQCEALTSLWTCDDWTQAGGATRIVPNSYRLRRKPLAHEGDERAIPLEAPKGSILFWDGAMWHGNCERTDRGDRVSLHTPCVHLARQVLESYDDLPDEIVDRNPPAFARMIGRELPWGKQTFTTPPLQQVFNAHSWAQEPGYPH